MRHIMQLSNAERAKLAREALEKLEEKKPGEQKGPGFPFLFTLLIFRTEEERKRKTN